MVRPIVCLLALSILTSCGDDSTAPPPEETHVALETGSALSQDIGPDGGTLRTTASDGTAYSLEIPAGSIANGQTITMTPILGIEGYPVAAGVAAGVDFEPAGLVFAVPARLTIETTKAPGAGTVPVAITYEGDATSFAPTFVLSGPGTFTLPIEHFSGASVAFATQQELESIMGSTGAPCLSSAVALAFAGDMPGAIAVFRGCFTSDVLPAIEAAHSDRDLAAAIGQYNMWKTDARLALGMPSFDDASETTQAQGALVPKLQEAIIRNNDRCREDQSFAFAANVLFWQTQAARFGIDSVANLLDRGTVLRNLCLRAVVDDFQLPSDMQLGFPHSIDLQFGVIFDGQAESQGAPFEVHLSGEGVSIQNPTGFTNSQGQYTTVVTALQEGSLSVTARACLIFPGTTTPTDVCAEGEGGTSGQDLTGSYFGTANTAGGVSLARLVLEQNQNAVSGTLILLSTHFTGHFTATLSESELLNVEVLPTDPSCSGGGLEAATAAVSQSGTAYRIQMSPTGSDCDGTAVTQLKLCGPNGASLSGTYHGMIQLRNPVEDEPVTVNVTHVGDDFSGTFSSATVSGSFSAAVADDPSGFVHIPTNVQITVDGCVDSSGPPVIIVDNAHDGTARITLLIRPSATLCSGRGVFQMDVFADQSPCP